MKVMPPHWAAFRRAREQENKSSRHSRAKRGSDLSVGVRYFASEIGSIHMTDSQTRGKIRVSTDGSARPYIMVPLEQLKGIRDLLDKNHVTYWVESDAISVDGKPAISFINLGLSADANKVQSLLDSAA
jgi:hypothetical protein